MSYRLKAAGNVGIVMSRVNPEKGDRFWTILERISRSNNVLAPGPYSSNYILLSRGNVEENLPITLPPTPVRATTAIGNARIQEAAYIEVSGIDGSRVRAKIVPLEEWPDQCPRDCPDFTSPEMVIERKEHSEELFSTDRTERVEWEGTQQKISEKEAQSRAEVFKEEDVRGKYNDLI